MGQGGGIRLPVLSVKLVDRDVEIHPIVEAPPGDGKTVLIGPGHVETFDPARFAEAVLCAARIERVFAQIVGTLE